LIIPHRPVGRISREKVKYLKDANGNRDATNNPLGPPNCAQFETLQRVANDDETLKSERHHEPSYSNILTAV